MTKNRMMLLGSLFLFLGICAIFMAGFAAFVNPGHGWQKLPVLIRVDSRGSDTVQDQDGGVSAVIDAITDPKEGWNRAFSGIVDAVPEKRESINGDGIPTIDFHDRSICVGTCLAVTNPSFNVSHTLVDADIYVNQRINFITRGSKEVCSFQTYYLEAVMVHEVGHVLGLDHTYKPHATMFPSTSACMYYPTSISQDDMRGIRYIY